MWLSFAIIILIGTLIVIFSDEFADFIKSLWHRSWFKLLAPLLVASYLVVKFDTFFTSIFNHLKVGLFKTIEAMMNFLPIAMWSLILVESVLILLITMAPIWLVDQFLKYRYKTKRLQKKYYIAFIIWLLLACLYTSGMEIN